MTAPCTHGMPTPAACVDCMYEGNVEPADRPAPETIISRSFPAAYDGECPWCGRWINAGDLIAVTSQERYVHAECTP